MDGSSSSTQSGGPRTQSELACNICFLRMPNSPVAASCGHVFCWPCLYRSWPQQGPEVQSGPEMTKSCPVCGMALREGFNIVPIYGYDNVASPRSGTEQPITTGTTTPAAEATPDTATSPRPTAAAAAPVSNTPIPPRPTAASLFTATPGCPHSILSVVARAAARAAAAAAPNTDFPSRLAAAVAAISSDTDISPRPNPPATITQTQMDAALDLHNLPSSIPRHGIAGETAIGIGAGDPVRPSSTTARTSGLRVAFRSTRRRRNFRSNPRGMDGNGGNSESHRARLDRLNEILNDVGSRLVHLNALYGAQDELEDALTNYISGSSSS